MSWKARVGHKDQLHGNAGERPLLAHSLYLNELAIFIVKPTPSAQLCTHPMPPTRTDVVPEVRMQLSQEQSAALERHVATVKEFQSKSVEAAEALAAIYSDRLFIEDGTFPDFVHRHFGIRRRRAYQLAKSGRTYAELRELEVDPLPRNEGQLRALATLDSRQDKEAAWCAALEASGGDAHSVTAEAVTLAATRIGLGELPLRSVAALGDGMQLAAVELELGHTPVPTSELRSQHSDLLDLLDPRDEAEVWRMLESYSAANLRVGHDADDGRISSAKRNVVRKAIRDVAASRQQDVEAPEPAAELQVLVREHLAAEWLDEHDPLDPTVKVGPSILTPYAGATDMVASSIERLDDEVPWPEEGWCRPDEIAAMRAMSRCRLEPELATWVWAVMIPAAKRSARAWFPSPEASSPCYVPARLRQPEYTTSSNLDRRLTTATTALLAPGVDLMRDDVPAEVVDEILRRAEAATDFAFLVATNLPDAASRRDWPDTVNVCIRVNGLVNGASRSATAAVASALSPFYAAEKKAVLVLDDVSLLLQQEALDLIVSTARAVILRGSGTSQAFYNQVLDIRSDDVAFVQTRDVRRRPAFAFMSVPPPEEAPQPVQTEGVPVQNVDLPRSTS